MSTIKNIGQAVVTPVTFNNGGILDKNGKMPVMLRPVSGKMPSKFVISGTIAENEGFEIGSSYLINIQEREASEQYGRQFQFQRLMKIESALDLVKITKELGEPVVFDAVTVREVVPSEGQPS
jgi:hypothetical protein